MERASIWARAAYRALEILVFGHDGSLVDLRDALEEDLHGLPGVRSLPSPIRMAVTSGYLVSITSINSTRIS